MKKKKTDVDIIDQSLVDIAVESWRFGKVFERVMSKLDTGNRERYLNQYTYFEKKVEVALSLAGLKIVNIEHQTFDIGMAATPLNMDDFQSGDTLFVDQMIEPIIIKNGLVLRKGTVMLGRVNQ